MTEEHKEVNSQNDAEITPARNYEDLDKRLKDLPVTYEKSLSLGTVHEEDVLKLFPDKKVIVCDFGFDEITQGEELPFGFQKGNILNIDHHAHTPRMEKFISSTNLAIEYVNLNGTEASKDDIVLINHCDTDSVLSSSIIRGLLQPEERFGRSAIAADHTGEADPIADLLQSIQEEKDLEFSFRNLSLLLLDRELEPRAQELLSSRLAEREACREIVESGKIRLLNDGKLAYAVLDHELSESAFLPALLPSSMLIVMFMPYDKDESGKDIWRVRMRAGSNIPPGFSIKKLGLNEVDPNFGGRWNSGANTRFSPDNKPPRGTDQNPDEYMAKISEKLLNYLNNSTQN